MKKCLQCGQTLSDDTKFCFKCGGNSFEQTADAGTYQQPPVQQQPVQQPAPPAYQQPVYQTNVYQQPAYQQGYNNTQPARIKNFLIFYLLMLIPIFNIVYFIMVAVGGPKYNVSLSNWCRATLIWAAIWIVIWIVLSIVAGAWISSLFGSNYY